MMQVQEQDVLFFFEFEEHCPQHQITVQHEWALGLLPAQSIGLLLAHRLRHFCQIHKWDR